MGNAQPTSREVVRIGAMTLRITREQKEAHRFYELLFALCERVLPGCGCDVVLLPERSALRPDDLQPLNGPHFQRFAALARQHGLFLLAPLAEAAGGGRCYNTHVVLSPTGTLVHAFRKVHLAPGEERQGLPGSGFAAFDLPWFRAGLMICFDNHFPESSRCLALDGAQVLFWPAFGNVARPGVDGARCIDNGVYIVSSGVVDMACDLPAEVFNRGAVTSPAGELLAQSPADDGLAIAELPLDPLTGRLRPPALEFNYLSRRIPPAYRPLVEP